MFRAVRVRVAGCRFTHLGVRVFYSLGCLRSFGHWRPAAVACGGALTLSNSAVQDVSEDQTPRQVQVARLAEVATLACTANSFRRMVAVVAFARFGSVRLAATRGG